MYIGRTKRARGILRLVKPPPRVLYNIIIFVYVYKVLVNKVKYTRNCIANKKVCLKSKLRPLVYFFVYTIKICSA